MKIFSILLALVLTSCGTLAKYKEELKPIAHEAVDEEIDKAAAKVEPKPEVKPAK